MPYKLIAPLFLWVLSTVALAADNYAEHPQMLALVDEMVAQEGFDREELLALFSQTERKQSILDAISRPAERTKPWHEYRDIFLTQKREQDGIAFYETHKETLARAEATTGVPREIIVAIIGVETSYGRITGSYRVMDALSTLAFDYPKRSTFFTKELKNYLLLTRDQGVDPLSLKGSYAGAMGYGQFMPSSYRAYAVDFDGDEKVDIWQNPVDAIGSVANYFKRHGWRTDGAVVSSAQLSGEVPDDWLNGKLKPVRTVGDYRGAGLEPALDLADHLDATGLRFELEQGYEYWMGLHNFYVITRYNHSAMYAMSVYQLSQRIAAGIAH